MTETNRLSGRVAVITGAGRGLGRRCALAFGDEGAIVVAVARSEGPDPSGTVEDTAAQVEAAGGSVLAWHCDVADPDALEDMVRAVRDRYGRIDILVNHAAARAPGGISTIQPRHWRRLVEVNLHGVFSSCRAVIPTMLGQGSGSIVNVSAGPRAPSSYRATRRAVEELSIGLAEEQAGNGIAVNVFVPGDEPSVPVEGSGGPGGGNVGHDDAEAVVRLSLQRPETCTGAVLDATAVLARLGPRPDPG